MTNTQIIDHVLRQPGATDAERQLAERLLCASEEIDLLVRELQMREAPAREEGGA